MSWLPRTPVLGDLEIVETWVEYDGPRVFTARSSTDQHYIAGWARGREEDDLWLYLPLSLARLQMVRSGGIALRDAFLRAEGFVYLVTLSHDLDTVDQVLPLLPQALEEQWLPLEAYRITLPTPTKSPMADDTEFVRQAKAEGRARFTLEVEIGNLTRTEAPVRKIGPLLVSLQNVFDNIGLAQMQANPEQTGNFSAELTDKLGADLIEIAAASFAIEIGSATGEDLFGDSPFARAAETLVGLLDVRLEPDALLDALQQLRPRGAKSFRAFVHDLSRTSGDVTVRAASTERKYRRSVLSSEQVADLDRLLKIIVPDDSVEIRGRMRVFSVDAEGKRFGAIDLFDGTQYEGKIADRAMEQAGHAVINDPYDVVVTATRSVDVAAGEPRERFILEQLVRSDVDTPIPTSRTLIAGSSLLQ